MANSMYNPAAIYVGVICAKGIRNVNWLTSMDVYAEVWIEGFPENKKRTCVAKGCGEYPTWDHHRLEITTSDHNDHPIRNCRSLLVRLMAKRYRWPTDKIIGHVTIPIKDLLKCFPYSFLNLDVCVKSGKTQGLLKLYCDFGNKPILMTNAQPSPDYQTQRTLYEQEYSATYNNDHMPEWPESEEEADSDEETDSKETYSEEEADSMEAYSEEEAALRSVCMKSGKAQGLTNAQAELPSTDYQTQRTLYEQEYSATYNDHMPEWPDSDEEADSMEAYYKEEADSLYASRTSRTALRVELMPLFI